MPTLPPETIAADPSAVATPPVPSTRRLEKKALRKATRAAARAVALASEREALGLGELPPDEPPGFTLLGLSPELLKAIELAHFTTPTPIQIGAIPPLLAGRDLLGQAQTGTGKTAAFALPLIQRLDLGRRAVQALVLVPTRELANQVAAAVAGLSRPRGHVGVLAVYGGQSMVAQLDRLARGVHVVVGTPGRVMDHLRRGSLSLDAVQTVVLDEADEMLRMGFLEDVEWILSHAPAPGIRQTALFSATLPPLVRRIAERHLGDPVSITIAPDAPAIETIDQRVVWVYEEQKLDVLCRILETEEREAALVFTRTRVRTSELADALTADGFAAEALHGEMSQAYRESVLRRLRSGDLRIVVATDVAARGLDVDAISLVVNYDLPDDPEKYVHRIGRTGRAGRAGVSVLFLDPRGRRYLEGVERFTRQRLREVRAPTGRDIADYRVTRFRAAVETAIATADLDVYRRVVTDLAHEGDHDMTTVAAAVAHLAADRRPLLPGADPVPVAPLPVRRPAPTPTPSRGRPSEEGMVTLVLSVGRDVGLEPGDIVGAIANGAGIPGGAVGAITIGERASLVDVRTEQAERVLARMGALSLRGTRARLRPARPGEVVEEHGRPDDSRRRHEDRNHPPSGPGRRPPFPPPPPRRAPVRRGGR